MDIIWQGIKSAFLLIFSGNKEIYEIILLTLKVSGIAVIISMVFGIPIGLLVGLNNFKSKRFVITIINTALAQRAVGDSGNNVHAHGNDNCPGAYSITNNSGCDTCCGPANQSQIKTPGIISWSQQDPGFVDLIKRSQVTCPCGYYGGFWRRDIRGWRRYDGWRQS
jgi:hypothetical protein